MSTVTLVNSSPQINTQPLSDSGKLKLKFYALVELTQHYEKHFEEVRKSNGRQHETIKSGVCLTPGESKISDENIAMLKAQIENTSDYMTQKNIYNTYRNLLLNALCQREPASLCGIPIPTISNIELFSVEDVYEIGFVLQNAKTLSEKKYGCYVR